MQYVFNVEIAKRYGVENAVFIQNLCFWIMKNKANKKHHYEGKYWTYNSTKAYAEIFPFWTERQVRRIIDNLKKQKVIECGNFNKKGYDRTYWYTVNDSVYNICLNGQMDVTESSNGCDETVAPIPYINTDNKTYINILEHWNSKNIVKHTDTENMIKSINAALKKYGKELIIEAIDNYSTIYHDKTYFYKHIFRLDIFLKQANGITYFFRDGQNWINYKPNKVADSKDPYNVNGR